MMQPRPELDPLVTGHLFGARLERRAFLRAVVGGAARGVLSAALAAPALAAPAPLRQAAPLLQAAGDWNAPPDPSKAQEQAADFQTYGMPDDWANYGKSIQAFCAKNGWSACHRTDTDMSSNEEITKFDAEKDNPIAVMADIGLLYGPVAEQKGVVPSYLPPSAEKLPEGWKAKTGGWVATFTGVPGFIVNTDVIPNVPQTWDDLLKPDYKGKIGMGDPRKSGTAATSFIAWSFAHGGDEFNLVPGVEYAKQLLPNIEGVAEGNQESLEKGEIPIQIKYDFNLLAAQAKMKEKGVNTQVIIPGISIYAPSALMVNKYNVAKMDLAKMFLEWVLSDDAQLIFAEFGARPVRYVLGDLQLPDSAKAKWLPDSAYANVKTVKDWNLVSPAQVAAVWDERVLGG